MAQLKREGAISALIIAFVAGFGYFWTLRANIRPLLDMTDVMEGIAEGAFDSAVRWSRTDRSNRPDG